MRVAEIRWAPKESSGGVVPVAEVEAACGWPSPSQDYQTTEIDLNEHLMPHRAATFIIRARGHSMQEAGIFDGDMTVKRLRITADRVVLSAENPGHPDIEVAEMSDLRVWGVVTRSLHCVART